MKINKYCLVVIGIALSLFIVFGCIVSSIEPPHVGVFLKKGGTLFNWSSKLVEMVEFKGVPGSYDVEAIPYVHNTRPVIVMWYPEVNLDFLGLYDREGKQVPYDVTQQEEILEIRPTNPLEDLEIYCLVQGDPTLPDSSIPYWCFRIFLLK
ncbi:hypothetical protein ACFLUA_04870 [Chloroflexota bacterium]